MFNPINVVGVQTAATPKQSRKKAADEPAVELAYGTLVRNNAEYAAQNGVLYRWNKSHFQNIGAHDPDGEQACLAWLAKTNPPKATPRIARECFKAALMMARPLPPKPVGRTIIPLQNAYLEIKGDGTIVRMTPDPALGITYALNAELSGAGNTYAPAPVSAGTLLGNYLTSSIPDDDVRNFLQELAGDTLVPTVRFQVATLLKGRGRNGKSIYTRLLAALHQKTASMRLDMLKGFQLFPLIGASLAIVDELPKSGLDEQTFKTLVSGEPTTIDIKHRDPIRYCPQAKWIISTNNDQKVSDNSDGFWRRLAIIPFDYQIPESQVIPCLDEKIIKDELALFLDWCLIGLQRLLQRGKLPPLPQAIKAAKQDAVEASNSVAAWLNETASRVTAVAATPKDKIYQHYAEWCDSQRLYALSAGQFWKALRAILPAIGEDKQLRILGKRERCVALTLEEPQPDSGDCPFDRAT